MIRTCQAAAAQDADEGRSVFAAAAGGSRIGEQLSDLPLTLRSDPAAAGLQCLPFEVVTGPGGGPQSVFDNGQPVPAVDWMSQGRLADLARTRCQAAQAGRAARPMPGNLILDAGSDTTLQQMIACTERGLLLTCLWYVREVDPRTLLLTGLTRDGVYLVEDGQVRGAVNNFRFNESPVDLLSRATEAGVSAFTLPRDRAESFRRVRMPPLRVPDFNMSTVSAAI
jgi:predicted Zn-dependent protease